jgi:hypothetical protein
VTPTTSKLVYTLIFDNSMLADDAAREKEDAKDRCVHAGAREHEDPRGRWHAAARPASRGTVSVRLAPGPTTLL